MTYTIHISLAKYKKCFHLANKIKPKRLRNTVLTYFIVNSNAFFL